MNSAKVVFLMMYVSLLIKKYINKAENVRYKNNIIPAVFHKRVDSVNLLLARSPRPLDFTI